MSLLSACTGHSPPPIADRTAGNERRASYVVQPRDTLYSIAWRYRLDVNGLARANDLASPYLLRPGQKLVLAERAAPRRQAGQSTRPPQRAPSETQRPASGSAPAARPTRAPAQSTPGSGDWRWPTSAPVTLGYNQRPAGSSRLPPNNGINYRLSATDAVVAAAAGDVVYAGAGLGGFETLLILRHSDALLSAYSFDGPPARAEGDRVKAGWKLADNPGRASGRSRLHFEIRREGDPVDPSTLIR